jgi:hypothetical protein
MGRYYSGDIEGKFWFGVQSSDDASNFGGTEEMLEDEEGEEIALQYSFFKEDIPGIEEALKETEHDLGDYKQKIQDFFSTHDSYNDEMITRDTGIAPDKVKRVLELYARIILGDKILACVKENGQCVFECEL